MDPQDQSSTSFNFASIQELSVVADQQLEDCKSLLELALFEKESLENCKINSTAKVAKDAIAKKMFANNEQVEKFRRDLKLTK